MSIATISPAWPARVDNAGAGGPFILVCEHASNHFPPAFGDLGLSAEVRAAHVAWDPGALALATALSARLDAVLVSSEVSRLIYDCNRPPDAPGAMAERSEVHDIPGNRGLSAAARLARVNAVYLPFHASLREVIARALAAGRQPVLLTIHSFTPVYFGQPRSLEFGVIHDAEAVLATAIVAEAQARTGLETGLNAPYAAADGVTHTLRLQALPYGLPNAMLEFRNDLIATPAAVAAMADRLAPVLRAATARMQAAETALAGQTRPRATGGT